MATENSEQSSDTRAWAYLFAAWCIALVSSLAALFIGEVMGQTPCLLCWFQRAFMFPLAILLGIACLRSDTGIRPYVLALAALGWAIATFHLLQYAGIVPEGIVQCGTGASCVGAEMTILGGVPLPLLSMGAFAAIAALMLIIRKDA